MKLTKKTIAGEDVYFENGIKKYTYYNSNNNEIHFKDSKDYETWSEFDSNNNEIHYKNNNGCETWSDNHPNHPKNKVGGGVEVEVEPFTFSKLV